jgi:phosphoribosylaminoimidazole-succinocarboxamide synthase
VSAATGHVVATDLPLRLVARGKVRDVYEVADAARGDCLLIVATDRISAFDHILATPIPDKGRILTQLSAFWFRHLREICSNHLITAEVAQMPDIVRPHAASLVGRAMLVRHARRLDVECVVRGYLAGSGWVDYQRDGAICGVPLPSGLREGQVLPEPIFTPATKASSGHDQNIAFELVRRQIGDDLAARLRQISLALYTAARDYAAPRGLLLADTKFEFGLVDGPHGAELLWIDEALTPDSSRYWDAGAHRAGSLVPLDKQFVRNYLLQIGWNREPPPPALPPDVVAATRERYRETYRRLTGKEPT